MIPFSAVINSLAVIVLSEMKGTLAETFALASVRASVSSEVIVQTLEALTIEFLASALTSLASSTLEMVEKAPLPFKNLFSSFTYLFSPKDKTIFVV